MYSVNLDSITTAPAIEWCNLNVNRKNWDLTTSWPRDEYTFTFTDAKDATWFSLKWIT